MSKAIFLGTFNPPHNGHINCLKSVIRSSIINKLNIERIHIIPCWQNPNKSFSIPFIDRYKMCTLEFAGLSDICLVDDVENEIQPQYTYDLLKWIHSGSDNVIGEDFWWIITTETFQEILDNKWKNSKDLIDENKFIIVVPDDLSDEDYKKLESITSDSSKYQLIDLINDPTANLHSTQLREMIKNGESVYPYINLGTQLYIKQNKLYK